MTMQELALGVTTRFLLDFYLSETSKVIKPNTKVSNTKKCTIYIGWQTKHKLLLDVIIHTKMQQLIKIFPVVCFRKMHNNFNP